MDLYLRKVIHPQAHDNYRVILKDDGLDVEVGSIGIQHGSGVTEHWAWGIDTVIPMRTHRTQGRGRLHAEVQRGVDQVRRRRGQPYRVLGGEAQAALISNLRPGFLTVMGTPSRD